METFHNLLEWKSFILKLRSYFYGVVSNKEICSGTLSSDACYKILKALGFVQLVYFIITVHWNYLFFEIRCLFYIKHNNTSTSCTRMFIAFTSYMGGDEVPESWRGGINITYKFGGPLKNAGWWVSYQTNPISHVIVGSRIDF